MGRDALTKIYDSEAAIYDGRYVSALHGVEDRIVSAFLRHFYKKGCRILDIGCGTGMVCELGGVSSEDYVGIDLSGRMVEKAQSNHPDHTFKQADAGKFEGGKVDLVASVYGPLNYIGLGPYLDILGRVLGSGGKFFSVVYTGIKNDDVIPPVGLQNIYSADDIQGGFLAAGYDVEIRGMSFLSGLGTGPNCESYLCQMGKTLAPIEHEQRYKYMIVSSPLC